MSKPRSRNRVSERYTLSCALSAGIELVSHVDGQIDDTAHQISTPTTTGTAAAPTAYEQTMAICPTR